MSIFTQNSKRNLSKNKFELNHEHKLSTTFGKLTPFLCKEVMPGDTWKVNTEILTRMAPMLAPVMHRINVYTHYFYVPNRILWDEWENFQTGGEQLDQNPVKPYFKYDEARKTNFKTGTMADYLGFPCWDRTQTPPTISGERQICALPFKAMASIYNEWYRDQDLQSPVDIGYTMSGDNTTLQASISNLKYRSWEKDYFTSARPNAQKGNPINFLGGNTGGYITRLDGTSDVTAGTVNLAQNPSDTAKGFLRDSGNNQLILEGTVQELRMAEAMQSYVERLQRTGNRYREHLAGIWGVVSSDARIDIPEYLGGGKNAVAISEVLQTAPDNATSPQSTQGDMFGHGVSTSNRHGFKRNFQEFGFIIGVLSILPKSGYSGGLHPMWTRQDRFDYPVPDLALIGEQPVYNRELWFNTTLPASTSQNDEFGYQQRYAEWKYAEDTVAGDFKYSLQYWHLTRLMIAQYSLNSSFIECNPNNDALNRIFNVIDPDQDTFWLQTYQKIDVIRGLPYYGVPDLT